MRALFVCTIGLGTATAVLAQTKPIRFDFDVTSGWSTWGFSGNENRFRQYATPPRGFYLDRIEIFGSDDWANDARFLVRGFGEDDYRASALFRLNAGTTKAFASDSRSRFFDPDPSVIDRSERRTTEGYAWQKVAPDLAIAFRTRQTEQRLNLADPARGYHQTTHATDFALRGSLWRNGLIDLSYQDLRYNDHTGTLRDTTTQTFSAAALQQVGDALALSGSYSHSTIRQPGVDSAKIDTFGFGGNLRLGQDTSLLLSYRNEHLDLPMVLNAYDRSRQEARARLVHRLGNGWTTQLGYSQLALERLRDDHAFVDVPRFHTIDFDLSGRLSRTSRVSLKLSHRGQQGAPVFQVFDARNLSWSSRTDARLKFDTFNARASAYAIVDWHQKFNAERDVRVRQQGWTVGAEWYLRPEIDCYAELSTDQWSGRTSDVLSPDLSSYFPDVTTLSLGANWAIDRGCWATANYTFYNSENDNPLGLAGTSIWASYFTGSFHYKASNDFELGLTFAPWQLSDTGVGAASYTSALLGLTAKMRF